MKVTATGLGVPLGPTVHFSQFVVCVRRSVKSFPTSVTQVVPAASSVAGRALGAGPAGSVRGLSNPVPPEDNQKHCQVGPPLEGPGFCLSWSHSG